MARNCLHDHNNHTANILTITIINHATIKNKRLKLVKLKEKELWKDKDLILYLFLSHAFGPNMFQCEKLKQFGIVGEHNHNSYALTR